MGDLLLMCQVETSMGVENTDQILDVDGVDGIFIGPLDLAASLGHMGETDHPVVRAALEKVEASAAKKPAKILAGFAAGRPLADMFSAGYRMVASTADMILVRQAAVEDASIGKWLLLLLERTQLRNRELH